MRIFVIGASGLIGRAVMDEAARQGIEAIGTGCAHADGSLRPFDARRQSLAAIAPDLNADDWVVLLAAHIDPQWVHKHPDESRALNVAATVRLAQEAWDGGAAVLFMSSESVFDGVGGGYDEDDTPRPLTLYARQKVEVEQFLSSRPNQSCVVRTGWTVDPTALELRCPVAATYAALLAPGARMASDNIFTLTDVRDTAEALIRLTMQSARGLYHVVSSPPVARGDLSQWIKDASRQGSYMSWQDVSFASLVFDEPRPARPWLRNDRFVAMTGMQFRHPRDIITAKVALLDAQDRQPRRASK